MNSKAEMEMESESRYRQPRRNITSPKRSGTDLGSQTLARVETDGGC